LVVATQSKRREIPRVTKTEELTQVPAEVISTPSGVTAPASLSDIMDEDYGKGLSTLQEDNIVPLVYILQAQSPQTMRSEPEYIDGACAGDIWLRNSGMPPAPGDGGIVVQPCAFSKDWVEWRPNRGGFVTRHETRPPDAREVPDPKDETGVKMLWLRKNGNYLVETRYHYVLINGRPFVIPMSSTGHTVSRTWMALMNGFKDARGRAAPSWSRLYHLTTVPKRNDQGTWYTWRIEDLGWVHSREAYLAGRQLYDEVSAGLKVADTAPDSDGSAYVGDDDTV
jgi:hypothetical protein